MKMNSFFKNNNQNGFTMVEMVVTLGISGIIVFLTSLISNNINTQLTKMTDTSDVIVDESMARRVMLRDMLQSSPSFNYLRTSGVIEPAPVDPDEQPDSLVTCEPINVGSAVEFWKLTKKDYCGEVHVTLNRNRDEFPLLILDKKPIIRDGRIKRKEIIFTSPLNCCYPDVDVIAFDKTALKEFLTRYGFEEQTFKVLANAPIVNDDGSLVDYAFTIHWLKEDYKKFPHPEFTPPNTDHCTGDEHKFPEFLQCIPGAGSMARTAWIPVQMIAYELRDPINCKKSNPAECLGFDLIKKIYMPTDTPNDPKIVEFKLAQNIKDIKIIRRNSSDSLVDVTFNLYLANQK